jgi:hypothetical protein
MSGCGGAAMNAIGCFANAAALVRSSRDHRPMIARSISFVASMRTTRRCGRMAPPGPDRVKTRRHWALPKPASAAPPLSMPSN